MSLKEKAITTSEIGCIKAECFAENKLEPLDALWVPLEEAEKEITRLTQCLDFVKELRTKNVEQIVEAQKILNKYPINTVGYPDGSFWNKESPLIEAWLERLRVALGIVPTKKRNGAEKVV